jgi:TRAP-type C4-dicarboxylate transport system permease small subunit
MARLWRIAEVALRTLALAALASLVLLPALQVVMRDVFTMPIIGLEEATRYGLIILVFLAVPSLLLTNEQIRLTEFVARLPRGLRMTLERVTLALAGISFAVIAVAGMASALKNASTRTPTLDIPFWLFTLPMVVGLAVGAAGYVWVAIRRSDPPSNGGSAML